MLRHYIHIYGDTTLIFFNVELSKTGKSAMNAVFLLVCGTFGFLFGKKQGVEFYVLVAVYRVEENF